MVKLGLQDTHGDIRWTGYLWYYMVGILGVRRLMVMLGGQDTHSNTGLSRYPG
jgi:hypothetical protein